LTQSGPGRLSMSAQHGFDVLADGVRRDILAVLAEHGECSSGEIAEHIGRVQRTTISSHLRVLRAAGAVAERRDGRYRYYSLDPAGPTRDALIFLQGLLGSGLSGLRSAAGPLAQPADGPGEAESLG
jgi:ArsR family transcriptional regulator, arsenate/arsenite/antimonite-responsive transcriptional repressor